MFGLGGEGIVGYTGSGMFRKREGATGNGRRRSALYFQQRACWKGFVESRWPRINLASSNLMVFDSTTQKFCWIHAPNLRLKQAKLARDTWAYGAKPERWLRGGRTMLHAEQIALSKNPRPET